jgi:hypothetical protein
MSDQSAGEFLLVWTSGGTAPRPVYYCLTPTGWKATYDRSEATPFPTARAALRRWLKLNAWPNEASRHIHSGQVRAEATTTPELTLTSHQPLKSPD